MNEMDQELQAGMVVWAAVYNPFENAHSRGKVRPAVLVERVGGHWRTMGLTSSTHYVNGLPRVSVPNPYAVGLRRPGQLWGDKLTSVYVLDIGQRIGWVDAALADAIADLARLPYHLHRQLLRAAEAHHGRTDLAA